MEKFYDYKTVDDRSIVQHAHETQMLAKELQNNECVLPRQVCGWRYHHQVTTYLVRFYNLSKAEEAGVQCVTNLVATLGVEEKSRAKDTRGKKVFDEGGCSAILVQKNSCFSQQEKEYACCQA